MRNRTPRGDRQNPLPLHEKMLVDIVAQFRLAPNTRVTDPRRAPAVLVAHAQEVNEVRLRNSLCHFFSFSVSRKIKVTMRVTNIIQALGLLVVISAVRLGKYPVFVDDAQRIAFAVKIKAQNDPPKKGKAAPYQGVGIR